MTRPSSAHELRTLVQSIHPLVVIETVEEERVASLLATVAQQLSLPIHEWSAALGLVKDAHLTPQKYVPMAPPEGGLVEVLGKLRTMPSRGLYWLKDAASMLTDPVSIRALREAKAACARLGSTIVLTGAVVDLPADVAHAAARLELRLPDRSELRQLVDGVLAHYAKTPGVRVDLTPEDIPRLVDALGGLTLNQARQTLNFCVLADGRLGPDDVSVALDRKAKAIRDGGLLEYYAPGDNRFELGGFERLKEWVSRAKVGYGEEARRYNLRPPKGILLAGVQGCGKSLAAKVIARELGFPLLKLDASRLYDRYVGATEANLRKALGMADSLAPCVLWIDEIEKSFSQSDIGGESALNQRILGTFLTWLQENDGRVFVAATANDVFKLPAELQRKGRFDELFFVDLPTPKARAEIMVIHLKLRSMDPAAFDGAALVAATEGFSGAELEQVVVGGLYRALSQKQRLDTALLLQEIKGTVPLSVSRREDLERLRALARERFVAAG